MKSHICGYFVVRLPAENADPEGRGAFPAEAPHVGSLFYGGIDRMPWFDLDERFYAGTLPPDLGVIRKQLHAENVDATGLILCRDLPTCRTLLEFCNTTGRANEIGVMYSHKIAKIKGGFDANDISWRGFDVVSLGEASLLREGLFSVPQLFSRAAGCLNEHGLFVSLQSAQDYAAEYVSAAEQQRVEVIWSSTKSIDVVSVGAVNVR